MINCHEFKPPVVFVTGAGISVASGLSTFRGPEPDAVWSQDTLEMGTLDFFCRHPLKQWKWYIDRFSAIGEAQPNVSHYVIAQYQKSHPDSWIVTQNIDGLHSVAGSSNVFEVHGSWRKVRCSSPTCQLGGRSGFMHVGKEFYRKVSSKIEASEIKTAPACPVCRKPLRPHVLWFDESYLSHQDYEYSKAHQVMANAGTLVFIGTSFSVGITSLALELGRTYHIDMFAIDPSPLSVLGVKLIQTKAEDFFQYEK